MIFAASRLNLHNKLDNDMFQHFTYVSNRIFMLAKKHGTDKEALEEMGKYIWRLFRVVQAYSGKRQKFTLARLIAIVNQFKMAFAGK